MSTDYRFALIGKDIGYSLSPHIFETVFAYLQVKGEFRVCSIHRPELGSCLERLSCDGFTGAAVTVPHKESVREFLDVEVETAKAAGAVNSIAFDNGRRIGYNTDILGFSLGLQGIGVNKIDGPVLIVGAGGAARAVIFALNRDFGVRRFVVLGRTEAKLRTLMEHFITGSYDIDIAPITCGAELPHDIRAVVNCTPLGGPQQPEARLLPEGFEWGRVDLYYDLNYNVENRNIAAASAGGAKVLDGSRMLVGQALESLKLWTGDTVPFDTVYESVFGNR